MIDHLGIEVSSAANSRFFYEAALAPLGYKLLMEVQDSLVTRLGFGIPPKPDLWLHEGAPQKPPLHIAFQAETRDLVDAFYRAAVAAGGWDNGAPGLRLHYHTDYYGAFVLDPDGNNVEACCHKPK